MPWPRDVKLIQQAKEQINWQGALWGRTIMGGHWGHVEGRVRRLSMAAALPIPYVPGPALTHPLDPLNTGQKAGAELSRPNEDHGK